MRKPEQQQKQLISNIDKFFCDCAGADIETLSQLGSQSITEHPTFWFYVPDQPNPTTPVDFMLTDVQGKQIYKQTFQLMGTPGVIGIALPGNTPALEVEKTYNWNFSFNCNSTNTREIVSVNGRIKRVQPNSQVVSQLQESTGRDRIIIYAENGFWYDTLTGLIELHRQNPQDEDLKSDWEDLLKSNEVKLPEIAREPIVSCCKSEE
ncbi:MAG: DUF928 domain-containing protein [Scytonema sp. PMC 1069.18]|nr:DUF928 domain-containing protein [Scytonema sp. PMC 1069.18]MEC4884746.1 DUF928 domain-containing protein [Scytonema sp. PMC 1070.18]